MSEERKFLGVWFPAEIWLNTELSMIEKAIYIEIESLDNDNHCTASNEYFAEFCQVSISTVSKSIKHLEELGMIQTVDFNGRVRKIRVLKRRRLPSKKTKAAYENLQPNNIYNNPSIKKNTIIKNNSRKLVKNKSLYEYCTDMITIYTKDKPGLEPLLVQYLKMRLEIKDKPLYKNQWKGILNKLDKIHEEEGQSYKDIVQFNIEKGYASFFPIPKYNKAGKKRSCDDELSNEQYTDEERKQIKKWQKEQIAKGERIVF